MESESLRSRHPSQIALKLRDTTIILLARILAKDPANIGTWDVLGDVYRVQGHIADDQPSKAIQMRLPCSSGSFGHAADLPHLPTYR